MWEFTVLRIAAYLVQAYYWIMIAAIFSTWIPAVQHSKVGLVLVRLTDPYFNLFRRFIPPLGMIDITPLIALFVFQFLSRFALSGLQTILNLIP